MPLTTRTIPAIHNGISRQPAILRSPDQTAVEINTWGEIATGVSRRPPTVHLGSLDISTEGQPFIHHINRDKTERYIVVIADGAIQVFDQTTGAEIAVASPGGLDYLTDGSFRAVTVADYTFIVNANKTVLMKDVGADEDAPPDYTYVPGGSRPAFVRGDPINPWEPSPEVGDVPIYYADPTAYPPNPASPAAITAVVQKFEDLPPTPADGLVYKIQGSAETNFTSYYVRSSGGVWDETVAPAIKNAIDEATMPHALIRKADGTFEFAPFSWRARRVGDEITNPEPTFVNRTIRDVFFYQNRLGFLVDEAVVFSVAGDYGDFWRRTVLDYLDADTVSVSATTTDVALLDYAVPFNDGIMLFSAQRQFSLSNGSSGLSATGIEINPVTSYVTSPGVRPVPLGSQVFFASEQGRYSTVQEYTRLDGSDATDAAEITSHVPGLLPRGVSKLIAAPDMNSLIVLVAGSDTKDRAYPYQFFWDGDRKIQSAWREWQFENAEVLSGTFVDGKVYLVIRRGSQVSLEAMDLRSQSTSEAQDHVIYLDRAVTITGTYNAGTGLTTFNLPYSPDPAKLRLVRTNTSTRPESVVQADTVTVTGSTVTVTGDESAHPVTAGETFRTYLQFSQQFPMDYQSRPLTTGRLQLHTWSVTYDQTAFFTAEVQPYGPLALLDPADVTALFPFTGQIVGDASFKLGRQAYRSGTFTFTVAGEAKSATVSLSNETPFASTWVSAEWEGLFHSRAL